MATVAIDYDKLGHRIRADAAGSPRAIKQALFSGAQRGRGLLVKVSPVDRGILRNAWRVLKFASGVSLVNDQPYAGIMERGARPFKMSRAGIEALAGWVKRKILDGGWGFFTGSRANQRQAISWAAKRQQQENRARNRAMGRGKNRQYGPKANVNMRSLRASVAGSIAAFDKEAMSIAYRIAKKFEKVGMRGRRFVWMNLLKLGALMDQEIVRFLTKFFNRPLSAGSGSEA